MLIEHYVPGAPLSSFVELFWLYDGYAQPHAKERIMPDGSMELVINLQQDQLRIYDSEHPERCELFAGALLAGPRSRFGIIDTESQASIIGIHFKPGGALPFCSVSGAELQDVTVSAESLWGASGVHLRERLLEAPITRQKFRVLEEWLFERTTKPLARHPAVRFALKRISDSPVFLNVAALADEIGISQRRLLQVFAAEVGLSPKLFSRISRFQQVLRSIHNQHEVDWAEVALSCGYYDQAHFNHDFRSFSGIHPTAYMVRRTDHLNHVPLVD